MGDCRDKALTLLGRRPHFRRELEQKLTQKGFASDDIESTLADLSRLGLIDDLGHARQMAKGPLTRKSMGPRRMRAELLRKGVEEEVVESVVGEVFPDSEVELCRAREAAGRKQHALRSDLSRVARYLDRKGFSKGVILQVLDEIEPG